MSFIPKAPPTDARHQSLNDASKIREMLEAKNWKGRKVRPASISDFTLKNLTLKEDFVEELPRAPVEKRTSIKIIHAQFEPFDDASESEEEESLESVFRPPVRRVQSEGLILVKKKHQKQSILTRKVRENFFDKAQKKGHSIKSSFSNFTLTFLTENVPALQAQGPFHFIPAPDFEPLGSLERTLLSDRNAPQKNYDAFQIIKGGNCFEPSPDCLTLDQFISFLLEHLPFTIPFKQNFQSLLQATKELSDPPSLNEPSFAALKRDCPLEFCFLKTLLSQLTFNAFNVAAPNFFLNHLNNENLGTDFFNSVLKDKFPYLEGDEEVPNSRFILRVDQEGTVKLQATRVYSFLPGSEIELFSNEGKRYFTLPIALTLEYTMKKAFSSSPRLPKKKGSKEKTIKMENPLLKITLDPRGEMERAFFLTFTEAKRLATQMSLHPTKKALSNYLVDYGNQWIRLEKGRNPYFELSALDHLYQNPPKWFQRKETAKELENPDLEGLNEILDETFTSNFLNILKKDVQTVKEEFSPKQKKARLPKLSH